MRLVRDISEEDSRAVREGLNEEYLAIFDLLCEKKENLSLNARDRVKEVAQSLLHTVKARLEQLENWQTKESTKSEIEQLIHNYLYEEETGLPLEDYNDDEIKEYSNVVYLHVFRQYGKAERSPYKDVA
jgi:type I restriction enzyme R subunit